MARNFLNFESERLGTSVVYFPITPDDANDLPSGQVTRAIIVSIAGNLVLTRLDDTIVTIAVPAGRIDVAAKKVAATGTTATGLTALC